MYNLPLPVLTCYALEPRAATLAKLMLILHRTDSRTVLCNALYTACVDASRTVFWDRSVLH